MLSLVHLPLVETLIAVAVALLTINALLGCPTEPTRSTTKPSRRGVAARMALSGALVLALTTASGVLGGTVAVKVAVCPAMTVLATGCVVMEGGTRLTVSVATWLVIMP